MSYEPGERGCGCAWEYRTDNLGSRWLVFTRRCGHHAVMCRSDEQWEADLMPPPVTLDAVRRRVRAVLDQARTRGGGDGAA